MEEAEALITPEIEEFETDLEDGQYGVTVYQDATFMENGREHTVATLRTPVVFEDEIVQQWEVGDTLDLTEYGMGTVHIQNIARWIDPYVTDILINGFDYCFRKSDSGEYWYLEYNYSEALIYDKR